MQSNLIRTLIIDSFKNIYFALGNVTEVKYNTLWTLRTGKSICSTWLGQSSSLPIVHTAGQVLWRIDSKNLRNGRWSQHLPTTLRHVTNIETWKFFSFKSVYCESPIRYFFFTITHTMTEVVYSFLDLNRTESLPGPLGLSFFSKSARRIKWSFDAKVRFSLAAVSALT